MMKREPAWRIFSRELRESTLSMKDDENDKFSPNYLISPLGAKMNRLFVVGVATEIQNHGDENDPFWKMRVSDINGVFFVSAGQYNPDVLKKIPKIAEPSFVALVGKVRTYTPEGGDRTYVSLTPEIIKEVDQNQRKLWILEAARSLRKRIEDYQYIKTNLEEPTRENIVALGFSQHKADGFAKAMATYPDVDLDFYRDILRESIQSLLPQSERYLEEDSGAGDMVQEENAFIQSGKAVGPATAGTAADDLGEQVCELVRSISSNSDGVDWTELVELAKQKMKLSQDHLEEEVNKLLDDGILFEPVLGKLKLV